MEGKRGSPLIELPSQTLLYLNPTGTVKGSPGHGELRVAIKIMPQMVILGANVELWARITTILKSGRANTLAFAAVITSLPPLSKGH